MYLQFVWHMVSKPIALGYLLYTCIHLIDIDIFNFSRLYLSAYNVSVAVHNTE